MPKIKKDKIKLNKLTPEKVEEGDGEGVLDEPINEIDNNTYYKCRSCNSEFKVADVTKPCIHCKQAFVEKNV